MSDAKEPYNIIRDVMTREALERFNFKCSCEDCSHFSDTDERCTLGFETAPFRKAAQLQDIDRLGQMAFCRAIEID